LKDQKIDVQQSIVAFTFECIHSCPEEIQSALWKHVILSGATTMLRGFDFRFMREMRKLKANFNLVEVIDRVQDVIHGANAVSAVSSAKSQFMKRPEENLDNVVDNDDTHNRKAKCVVV